MTKEDELDKARALFYEALDQLTVAGKACTDQISPNLPKLERAQSAITANALHRICEDAATIVLQLDILKRIGPCISVSGLSDDLFQFDSTKGVTQAEFELVLSGKRLSAQIVTIEEVFSQDDDNSCVCSGCVARRGNVH